MPGQFREVPQARIPTKFQGFFQPVSESHMAEVGNGKWAAVIGTGLAAQLLGYAPLSNGKVTYGSFNVEVYLRDMVNSPTIPMNEAPKKSIVREDIIKAEEHYAKGSGGDQKFSITQDGLARLLFHEIGHYRIARLMGLELHRTLLLDATLGFRVDQPSKLYERFDETLANYRLLKDIVQLMYDVSTRDGSNVDEQTRWACDVIGRGEREVSYWNDRALKRNSIQLWPGLLDTIVSPTASAPQAEHDLARAMISICCFGPINTTVAKEVIRTLEARKKEIEDAAK
jgi:hypothetical protein